MAHFQIHRVVFWFFFRGYHDVFTGIDFRSIFISMFKVVSKFILNSHGIIESDIYSLQIDERFGMLKYTGLGIREEPFWLIN